MRCCEYGPLGRINNTSISPELKNGPNKLECYIAQGLKNLLLTNTLAYWATCKF